VLNGVSPSRTVISIADRMPEIGKALYETGPASGIARVARYLEDQVAVGVLAVDDCELAAASSWTRASQQPSSRCFSTPQSDRVTNASITWWRPQCTRSLSLIAAEFPSLLRSDDEIWRRGEVWLLKIAWRIWRCPD
jgi:hypothetical protein